jgi:hypothetical protein
MGIKLLGSVAPRGQVLLGLSANSKDQARLMVLLDKPLDDRESGTKEILDFLAGTIRCAKPYELGRLAEEDAAFLKIRIFGNDCEVIVLGVLPNGGIVRVPQSASMNMH